MPSEHDKDETFEAIFDFKMLQGTEYHNIDNESCGRKTGKTAPWNQSGVLCWSTRAENRGDSHVFMDPNWRSDSRPA